MATTSKFIEEGLPQRAYKSFLYYRPIRRYDHYCKWVNNVIGLLNHREFILMVGGVIATALLGVLMDLWVAILAEEGSVGAEVAVASCPQRDRDRQKEQRDRY
eukprot:g24916.t1